MAILGGCRCGSVRYTLALDVPPRSYACHCLHCQTWSGSAFSEQARVPDDLLSVTGPLVTYDLVGPSGHTSIHRLCGACYTRLYNTNSALPGLIVLRAGTLDPSDRLEPSAHIWVNRKQPWVVLPDGVATWEENAPSGALAAMLG